MSLDWSLVANVASVVGTVGGLLFVWWQVRQLREVNAYGLLRDEVKRFNSPEMRACRARLARTLLSDRRNFERIEEDGKEVLGFLEDIGQRIFGTPKHVVTFGPDPLAILGVQFRLRDCLFPFPGLYSVQFWYNDTKVEERPLLLR